MFCVAIKVKLELELHEIGAVTLKFLTPEKLKLEEISLSLITLTLISASPVTLIVLEVKLQLVPDVPV
jgi:hypothetical protein